MDPIFRIPRSPPPPQHHRRVLGQLNPLRAAPRAPRRHQARLSPPSPRFVHDDLARLSIDTDRSSDFEPLPHHHHHQGRDRRVNYHHRVAAPLSPTRVLHTEDVRLRTIAHPGRLSMSSAEVYLLPTLDYHLPVTLSGHSPHPIHFRAVIPGCFTSDDLVRALGLRGTAVIPHAVLVEDAYHVMLVTRSGRLEEMPRGIRMDFLVQGSPNDRPAEVIIEPKGGRSYLA